MSNAWGQNRAGARSKAEYLAKQGCALGSIRRMVSYEFGWCPSDSALQKLVDDEAKDRAKIKRRYSR